MGYDVENRKLIVNETEARIVIDFFRCFLVLRSVHALRDALADAGIKSKRRTRSDGTGYGGQMLSRGALYLILQKIASTLARSPTRDSPIPENTRRLSRSRCGKRFNPCSSATRVDRATGVRGGHPSLLTGMVFDETGERLTSTHAVKKGTRYRYYVSTSLITGVKRIVPAAGGSRPAIWKAW